jgi:hypothetical protein
MKWEFIKLIRFYFLPIQFFFLFFSFLQLVSNYGFVVQQEKVALSSLFLLQSMIAGSVHANMEVWPTPELLGNNFLFPHSRILPE